MSPVTIENDALRMEVYPQFGGKVSSIIDKLDRYELLFDYAAELPTGAQYDRNYSEGWHAGSDECFPAVGAGPYPAHPYKEIAVPDHGELWGLPTIATPARDGITTSWHGLRFGYVFSRKLWLDGPSIVAEYSVTNLAPFDFHFVWAQHPLLSLHDGIEIELSDRRCRLSHDHQGHPAGSEFDWPRAPGGLDFSKPLTLPSRQGWKLFCIEPISRPARVVFPSRRRQLSIEYISRDGLSAYWGIWISTGGWMGHRHLAIEPTTGRYDQLDRSFADGSCGLVRASAQREWTVRWTLS